MRQKKEPNVPKRNTNRSMTKTTLVKHVATPTRRDGKQVRAIFQTSEDISLREIEENGTFTIPDMVRLITEEQRALDRSGRPRKVLTCEPRQHFKCAARNRIVYYNSVLRSYTEDVD